MESKPQNILVKRHDYSFEVYIANFGIARAYETTEAVETDGKTSFTRRYAAPEVVSQEVRGLSADIFSLGCVFLEIYDTCHPQVLNGFLEEVLNGNPRGDISYHANVSEVQDCLSKVKLGSFRMRAYPPTPQNLVPHAFMIKNMLNADPKSRPTADELVRYFGERPCCKKVQCRWKLPPMVQEHLEQKKYKSFRIHGCVLIDDLTCARQSGVE